MTIAEPIPDLQWGKGNWQDYISNWRTRDTGWMQERLILRYQTPAARTTDWGASPKAGQVTYNDMTQTLEMWHPTKASWVRSLMFQNLVSSRDDATGVNLFHASSPGKGVTIGPGVGNAGLLTIDAPTNFLSGLGLIDSTGLSLKVGAKTAKLATDADNLTVDSPVKAPSVLADTATVVGALTAGSVSASSMAVTSTLTLTGATVSGGILNPTSATIGGVAIGANLVTASGGLQSGQGNFTGDASTAIMRQRVPGGALGSAFLQVGATDMTAGPSNAAGSFYMYPFLRIMQGKGIAWHNAGGTHQAWISPVIYSGGDPGAGNFPDGTLWIS